MSAVSVPILPTGLWLLASAGTIGILLVLFFQYLYLHRRFLSAQTDFRDLAELAARKEQLQADEQELRNWITRQRDELARLQSEREEQERLRGELSRLQGECAAAEQRSMDFRKEAGEFETQRHTISQTIERLGKEANELSRRIEELKKKRDELASVEGRIEEAHTTLGTAKEELLAVKRERDDIVRQLADKRIELDALHRECDGLDRSRRTLEEDAKKAKTEAEHCGRDAEEARQRLEETSQQLRLEKGRLLQLEERLHELERETRRLEGEKAGVEQSLAELDKGRHVAEQAAREAEGKARRCIEDAEAASGLLDDVKRQLQEKCNKIGRAEEEIESLNRQNQRLETERISLEKALADVQKRLSEGEEAYRYWADQARKTEAIHREKASLLERIEGQLGDLEKRERRLGVEVAALVRERDSLIKEIEGRSGSGHVHEDPYADLLQEPPPCLNPSLLPNRPFPFPDEEFALAEIRTRLGNAGYHFHERVIRAFHTALKCHDINPLTVLAGVSGTGKTLLPTAYARLMGMHSLIIAVQPRWDSPQDMFGFYNYLEKKYKATDLSRALIRMDPFNTAGLDKKQMRSDRVLLVLLDEMNLARTEYYFSEFLSKLELRRLAGTSQTADRQHAEVLLDTGPGRKQITFWVGRNVLFAGTMNEDETTQTLSDKVLDRANVLRFGRPPKMEIEEQQQHQDKALPDPLGSLTTEQWERWCQPFQASSWNQQVHSWIDGLNDALTKVGRPFGHRIRKSILAYVSNYPGVNNNQTFKDAFADQIEQKILPKLRGLDTMEGINNAAFDDLGKIIDETGDEVLRKTFAEARDNNASRLFLWQGVTRETRRE